MKVLVYGSKGWIGQQVIGHLQNKSIEYVLGEARVDNVEEVECEIVKYLSENLTHVFSFIGRTHGTFENQKIETIDYLEKPGKLVENVRDNLFSPMSLAIICLKYGVHLTYLGTGCIFDYDNEIHFRDVDSETDLVGFNEMDKPNFFGSSYSIVKGFTDRLMHILNKGVLNVRIRMPITDEVNPRNFITKISKYQKICSIPNSMTVLDELIPIMIDMAMKCEEGTVNMTNPGRITHNEILEMYKEIIDPNFTWENFSIEEQNQILASKRSNNFLETSRLEEFAPNVNNIHDSVRMTLMRMKEKML